MSHYDADLAYNPIFEDQEFLSKLDSREKCIQYYWMRSKEFYGKGIQETVSEVLQSTCHVACTHQYNSATRKRFLDLEKRVINCGARKRRGYVATQGEGQVIPLRKFK